MSTSPNSKEAIYENEEESMTPLDALSSAIAPAISAGLGALTLRNRLRNLSINEFIEPEDVGSVVGSVAGHATRLFKRAANAASEKYIDAQDADMNPVKRTARKLSRMYGEKKAINEIDVDDITGAIGSIAGHTTRLIKKGASVAADKFQDARDADLNPAQKLAKKAMGSYSNLSDTQKLAAGGVTGAATLVGLKKAKQAAQSAAQKFANQGYSNE